MKEPQIAARVAGIAHAKEDQRQGELDELVAGLKRVMIDAMERKNDFATLRAIDMIARLRGLTPTTAKRSGGVEAALEEMHRLSEEDEETAGAEAEPEAALEAATARPSGNRVRPADAARTAAARGTGPGSSTRPAFPRPSPCRRPRRRPASRPRRGRAADLPLRTPDGPSSRLSPDPRSQRRAGLFRRRDTLLPPELWPGGTGQPVAGATGNDYNL